MFCLRCQLSCVFVSALVVNFQSGLVRNGIRILVEVSIHPICMLPCLAIRSACCLAWRGASRLWLHRRFRSLDEFTHFILFFLFVCYLPPTKLIHSSNKKFDLKLQQQRIFEQNLIFWMYPFCLEQLENIGMSLAFCSRHRSPRRLESKLLVWQHN